MPDEKEYQSHLLTFEEACARLKGCWMDDFAAMLCMAYALWQQTTEYLDKEREREQETERVAVATSQQESQVTALPDTRS